MLSAVHLASAGCLTALGDSTATHAALLAGRRGLQAVPFLGRETSEPVPLALAGSRALDETAPPNWLAPLQALVATIPAGNWGSPREPVFVTSSNFGVGSLYAFRRQNDPRHAAYGTPHACVDWLAREFNWGPNISTFSHACVSAHLGLLQASRTVEASLADRALVFSFDFISPFVAGGFNALKILNAGFPAPYSDLPTGSIGLGDGAAFAVITRRQGDFVLEAQSLYNEMHHFTANRADGTGFTACLAPLRAATRGRTLWLKGHGTGTLDAGRLESAALSAAYPEAPLVSWKGSLGHTLGSCGLVELSLAMESIRTGRAPGTIGGRAPFFTPQVAAESFSTTATDGVLCASNAFGGAHAAFLLSHA